MPDDLASVIALRRMQLVDLKANADAGDDGAKAALERVGAELAKLEGWAASAPAAPAAPPSAPIETAVDRERLRIAAQEAAAKASIDAAIAATATPAPAADPVADGIMGRASEVHESDVPALAEIRQQLADLVDHVTDAHTRITRLEATLASVGALSRS